MGAADLETLQCRDFFGESSLHVASRIGLTEVAKKLVERLGLESIGAKNTAGMTPLHLAMEGTQETLAAMLVEMAPPEVLRSRNRAGESYHQVATRVKLQDESFRMVVEKADDETLQVRDGTGETCLHNAVRRVLKDVVMMIVDQLGGSVNVQNHRGDTPVHLTMHAVAAQENTCKNGKYFSPDLESSE